MGHSEWYDLQPGGDQDVSHRLPRILSFASYAACCMRCDEVTKTLRHKEKSGTSRAVLGCGQDAGQRSQGLIS